MLGCVFWLVWVWAGLCVGWTGVWVGGRCGTQEPGYSLQASSHTWSAQTRGEPFTHSHLHRVPVDAINLFRRLLFTFQNLKYLKCFWNGDLFYLLERHETFLLRQLHTWWLEKFFSYWFVEQHNSKRFHLWKCSDEKVSDNSLLS